MSKPPPLVLFDLDGTLADSQAGILASYRVALGELGISATDVQLRESIGPPIDVSLAKLGVGERDIVRTIEVYRGYYSMTGLTMSRPYDGVHETLEELCTF